MQANNLGLSDIIKIDCLWTNIFSGISYRDIMSNDNDPELIDNLASESLDLFRLNVLVIAVYSSVIGFVYDKGDLAIKILNSVYTLFGLILWIGTMVLCLNTYRKARRCSVQERGLINNPTFEYNIEEISEGVILIVISMISSFILLVLGGVQSTTRMYYNPIQLATVVIMGIGFAFGLSLLRDGFVSLFGIMEVLMSIMRKQVNTILRYLRDIMLNISDIIVGYIKRN